MLVDPESIREWRRNADDNASLRAAIDAHKRALLELPYSVAPFGHPQRENAMLFLRGFPSDPYTSSQTPEPSWFPSFLAGLAEDALVARVVSVFVSTHGSGMSMSVSQLDPATLLWVPHLGMVQQVGTYHLPLRDGEAIYRVAESPLLADFDGLARFLSRVMTDLLYAVFPPKPGEGLLHFTFEQESVMAREAVPDGRPSVA